MIAFFCLALLIAEPLPVSESCHTQGMKILGDAVLVSCVDQSAKQARLYRFAWPDPAAAPVERKDLTDGPRYHPSGLDFDGGCLWVAAAEYRPHSSSRVSCLDPNSLKPRSSFAAPDHIGALAAPGNRILGFNWDSRGIFLWDREGRELDHGPSPFGAAYQDCKALDEKTILCGGILARGKFFLRRAVVDRIQVDPESVAGFSLLERRVLRERSREGHLLTREAMDFFEEMYYFIPDDFPGAAVYTLSSLPVLTGRGSEIKPRQSTSSNPSGGN